jgi:alkylhydroperoxidase family enzyme
MSVSGRQYLLTAEFTPLFGNGVDLMAWIAVTSHESATASLKIQYDAAVQRAGRIWNIVSVMSPNPEAMKASMGFYRAIMFGSSPLSRQQREMLAVVVSAENQCLY